jgi:ribonuclease Z
MSPSAAMPPTPSDEVDAEMVYVCQAAVIPGKFDAKRAAELGVPNGPIRAKLVKGQEIEFEMDGEKRIVKPEDVLSGGGPGAVSKGKVVS